MSSEDLDKLKEYGTRKKCVDRESFAKEEFWTHRTRTLVTPYEDGKPRQQDVNRLCFLHGTEFGIGYIFDITSDHRLHVIPTGEEGDDYLENHVVRPLHGKLNLKTVKIPALKQEIEKSSIVCGDAIQRLKDIVDKNFRVETTKDISDLKLKAAIDNSMKMNEDQTRWVAEQISKPGATPQTTLTDDEGTEIYVEHFRYNGKAEFKLDYKDKGIFKEYYPFGYDHRLTEKVCFWLLNSEAEWPSSPENEKAYFDEIHAEAKNLFFVCGTSVENVIHRAFKEAKAQRQQKLIEQQISQLGLCGAIESSKNMDEALYFELVDHFKITLGAGEICSENETFLEDSNRSVAAKGFYVEVSDEGKDKLMFDDKEYYLKKEVAPQGKLGDELIKHFILDLVSNDLVVLTEKDRCVHHVLQKFRVCGGSASIRVEALMNTLQAESLQARLAAIEKFEKNEGQFRKHIGGILKKLNVATRQDLQQWFDTIDNGLSIWKKSTEANWEKFIFTKDDFKDLLERLSSTGELPHPAFFLSKNRWVNWELRRGNLSETSKKEVDWLKSALKKEDVSKAGYVYRGMNQSGLPEAVKDMLQPGKEFVDPGFMSTSLNMMQAWKFAAGSGTPPQDRLFLRIKQKTGREVFTHVHETYKAEEEVLFLPDTRFHVTHRNEQAEVTIDGNQERYVSIDMEEMSE